MFAGSPFWLRLVSFAKDYKKKKSAKENKGDEDVSRRFLVWLGFTEEMAGLCHQVVLFQTSFDDARLETVHEANLRSSLPLDHRVFSLLPRHLKIDSPPNVASIVISRRF